MDSKKSAAPELLAPAGDMESFEAAVRYGADAVYIAGTQFGMRTAPVNFSFDEIKRAVGYAHENSVRVYLACNILPGSGEMGALSEHIKQAALCGADAFIVSDIGTLRLAKRIAPETDIHISTQAGVTNYETAEAYYEMGAKRVIPARELSLDELQIMREKTPSELEIECFVHGAMCVSFSGRCLLSGYLTGRSANKGDCAQPCRWKYSLVEETRPGEYYPVGEDADGTYIMNARDMCMIRHIPELVSAGISSFKIEGRAKSAYYVAVVTNAYRCAIDGYFKLPSPDYVPEKWILDEMARVSHREYCTGFFFGSPKDNAEIFYEGGYKRFFEVSAIVLSCEDGVMTCEQRNRFFAGDELEVMEPGKPPIKIVAQELQSMEGEPLEAVPHPVMRFKMKAPAAISGGAIIRREIT